MLDIYELAFDSLDEKDPLSGCSVRDELDLENPYDAERKG